jgi:AcrR family transcriptional regulator
MGQQDTELASPTRLQPRRSPLQERAKQTVEKILDATAELLHEKGHTRLTTKKVAERSGINIATLYHYFPNKMALLHALALRITVQQKEQLDAVYDRRAETDWRDTVDKALDALLEFNRTVTGAVALSLAMRSYPSLRQIDYERDLQESELRSQLLSELGIKGSPRELQLKSLVLAEVMTAMVDYALQFYPEKADAAMDEVKRMVKLYIEDHLRQSAEDPSSVDTADQEHGPENPDSSLNR